MTPSCTPSPSNSAILNKNKNVHIPDFSSPLVQKMTAATPLSGKSIYLRSCQNVSKKHKREVRKFGDSRGKGSRVLAASLMVWAKKPPPKKSPLPKKAPLKPCRQ